MLIPNALQPAEIDEVMLCHLLGRAIVLVRDDQLSLAIGRRGSERPAGLEARGLGHRDHDRRGARRGRSRRRSRRSSRIEGVETELAERLVEQGILSFDDLSVMEIADLVNTIEGLSEEQAIEIVTRAETLAEEQTEDLPRRKGAGGRGPREAPPPTADGVEDEAPPGRRRQPEAEGPRRPRRSTVDDDARRPRDGHGEGRRVLAIPECSTQRRSRFGLAFRTDRRPGR